MIREVSIASLEELEQFAKRLAAHMTIGDVITLEGDLGAGKTTFAQYIARALHIEETVSSPTFTIMKQYEGTIPLYHLDVYRLEGSDEDLGWDEIFGGDALVIVEWARYIEDVLPLERLQLDIHYVSPTMRRIELKPYGARYEAISEAVVKR